MIISSMVAAFTKALKFMSDDDEIHQQTDDDGHQHDHRFIDGWFHKNQSSVSL